MMKVVLAGTYPAHTYEKLRKLLPQPQLQHRQPVAEMQYRSATQLLLTQMLLYIQAVVLHGLCLQLTVSVLLSEQDGDLSTEVLIFLVLSAAQLLLQQAES